MKLTFFRWLCLLVPGIALTGSCFAEPGPTQLRPALNIDGGSIGDASQESTTKIGECPLDLKPRTAPAEAQCRAAQTAEQLPARSVVSDENAARADVRFLTDDLFALFKAQCQGCHVDQNQGGFNVTRSTFSQKIDDAVLNRMRSDNPDEVMPPLTADGKLWRDRQEGDAVRKLVALLERWREAGSPVDFFIVPGSEGGKSPFFMAAGVAQSLTNLGSCVPDAALVATAQEKGCTIDAKFAALKRTPERGAPPEEYLGLPKRLEETDLFTLDTEELARHGVVAFAPAYPLWSDGAGKLRHVRVPFGQSIRFNKETQEFEIPKNTRFYKTFLKKVVEVGGNERWKKIETRLIVARPGEEALFGTYEWNEAETEAVLLTEPYRDYTPFRDKVITTVTDEPAAIEVQGLIDAGKLYNWTFEMEKRQALRRYAIPGRDRCIQCHMGSQSRILGTDSGSFVLGFTPLQVWRRPQGEGGVIEPSGPDELTQLDRLIQYGIITGITSSTEITPLERSQEPRKPRNEHELMAQSYMLGNCAHCHNPRGFPSVEHSELAPLLNFWPSKDGGIFEFPLEAYSPRIKRGIDGEIPIPYITPSIRDRIPEGAADRPGAPWTPKHRVNTTEGSPYRVKHLSAPWRSLIWRNADTPFTYADEAAIYPHMPLNTPGFDCRAPRIFGDWMVSIPSVRKHPELDENRPTYDELFVLLPGTAAEKLFLIEQLNPIDRTPQPFREIKPGDPSYEQAAKDAQIRLNLWRTGPRYNLCPDASDIQDPTVLRAQRVVPEDNEVPIVEPAFTDGVPDRPHWVETDLTELPPPWSPRRNDWNTILIERAFPEIPQGRDYEDRKAKQDAEKKVVNVLGGMLLKDVRQFALTEVPFGLWLKKPNCNFNAVPKVKDFPENSRPQWMAKVGAEEPVFTSAPGEAVYDMICVNCHGVNADSKGIQAQKVAELTGGKARVANFMSGLLGPATGPGQNQRDTFKDQAGATGEDWAARYLGWMALGGTQAPIPSPILQLVGRTEVLGKPRAGYEVEASPNMLAVVQDLCRFVLPSDTYKTDETFSKQGDGTWAFERKRPFITENGDAELWQRACSLNNPVVRVLTVKRNERTDLLTLIKPQYGVFAKADNYGNAPVVDHRGKLVQGITGDNLFPWCIQKPASGDQLAIAEEFVDQNRIKDANGNDHPLPFCPATTMTNLLSAEEIDAWAKRGALNAGFSVFLFLNELANGRVDRTRYNECEKLTP
jgi:mono/diheme cytochrome c family protein